MNIATRPQNFRQPPSNFSILDAMLADLAARVQLPRFQHDLAVQRYETIRDWIDRLGSPLQHLVALMYPQGSMATDTTIARYSERDEFDIDIMADLISAVGRDPQVVLAMLYQAIKGEPGSRYFEKTTLNTRCVTVQYEDMHLDITPDLRRPYGGERECEIFHHKPNAKPPDSKLVEANPYGFAEWFKSKTPAEADFATFFARRSIAIDQRRAGKIVMRADGEDVPEQAPFYRKSKAVVILQLIKRWRNVRYDKPDRRDQRRPPSILLAKLVADNAARFIGVSSLADALIGHVEAIRDKLRICTARQALIDESNPVYQPDVLTDRWPGNLSRQNEFIADLMAFLGDLYDLRDGKHDIDGMRRTLGRLFGDRPVHAVMDDFRESLIGLTRKQKLRFSSATGAVAAPSLINSPAAAIITPHNKFGRD
jgi:hypothetical protein